MFFPEISPSREWAQLLEMNSRTMSVRTDLRPFWSVERVSRKPLPSGIPGMLISTIFRSWWKAPIPATSWWGLWARDALAPRMPRRHLP